MLKIRDKKRPVLETVIASLVIGSAVAFTAGCIYWAIEGTKIYEESVKRALIERGLEHTGVYREGSKLKDYGL